MDEQVRGWIKERAHEICLERGGGDGHELDDWLQAEQEVMQELFSNSDSED
jgi:hypothetical protein